MDVQAETLIFDEAFSVPEDRLWRALTNSAEREVWGRPAAHIEVKIDGTARSGGTETQLCLVGGVLVARVEVEWIVVEDGATLVWAERAFQGDDCMHVALCTQQIRRNGLDAAVHMVAQVTSIGGPDGINGFRTGMTGALLSLRRYLQGDTGASAS